MTQVDRQAGKIEFFFWPTPNCWKVSIMLEELGLDYVVRPVDIGKGEQYSSAFEAVSPNNKVPAITDHDPAFRGTPYSVFESAAILLYLGEKHARLIPSDPARRYDCLQWVFWQVGGLGPMGGQAHHFRLYASEQIPYAIERYTNECHRLYGVMDRRLINCHYLAEEYSIADIACFPWIHRHERQGQNMQDFPALARWYEEMLARPAVRKGLALAAELRDDAAFASGPGREILFGLQRPEK